MLNILIVIVGLGAALVTFEPVRHLGSSLLASAGIGGIILGFAAKPVLGNLLAGMQIALTQPFRIDDVLHVQGEWCWVEEVTATYVVLRVWDLRRLVVPLQWFIENPFQNWSRNDTEMMGTVFITVDYSMPIEPLRTEFERLLEQAPDWDGKTKIVQVTEAKLTLESPLRHPRGVDHLYTGAVSGASTKGSCQAGGNARPVTLTPALPRAAWRAAALRHRIWSMPRLPPPVWRNSRSFHCSGRYAE